MSTMKRLRCRCRATRAYLIAPERLLTPILICGLVCNFFVKPVNPKHWMSEEELARERALQHENFVSADAGTAARGKFSIGGVLAWLAVGIPFLIGLFIALQKAVVLL